jgi:hypothetical protein
MVLWKCLQLGCTGHHGPYALLSEAGWLDRSTTLAGFPWARQLQCGSPKLAHISHRLVMHMCILKYAHSRNHCWIIGTSSSFRSVFTCPLLNVPSPDVPLPQYTPLLTLPHALLTFSHVSCFLFFHCAHHFKWARKSRGRQV